MDDGRERGWTAGTKDSVAHTLVSRRAGKDLCGGLRYAGRRTGLAKGSVAGQPSYATQASNVGTLSMDRAQEARDRRQLSYRYRSANAGVNSPARPISHVCTLSLLIGCI